MPTGDMFFQNISEGFLKRGDGVGGGGGIVSDVKEGLKESGQGEE